MEEYLSTDIYVSKRNNSLINGKMIGRVLGVLLFIEAGLYSAPAYPWFMVKAITSISFIRRVSTSCPVRY